MPKISPEQASQVETIEGSYEGRFEELGGYTVAFEHYLADDDLAPLFVGLPDDHCQCPHWGVVLEGKVSYKYSDGTEDVITAGEAYYARPGHTPVLYADTRLVEFSPTGDLEKTMEVVMRNIAAMQEA